MKHSQLSCALTFEKFYLNCTDGENAPQCERQEKTQRFASCVAVFCSALQCVAVCCGDSVLLVCALETVRDNCRNTLQHTATHCNTLQHSATHCNTLQHTAAHCSTLEHTATHFNTLQHTAKQCNTLQHTATHCNTLQHTATHYNTLQHTATHWNAQQRTATHCNTVFVPASERSVTESERQQPFSKGISLQGGEDSQDPLSCISFSTKETLNIGHFCGKWPIRIRDPMSLRHPVLNLLHKVAVELTFETKKSPPAIKRSEG